MKPQMALTFLVLVTLVQTITPVSSAFNAAPATAVTVRIDFSNGTVLIYPNVEGADVFEVTQSVAEVEAEWYGDLVFVVAIAGVHEDTEANLWWQYWVNGELGPIAANKYQLQDNDTVEWRRQSSQMTTEPGQSPDTLTVLATIVVAAFSLGFLYFMHRRKLGGP